MAVIPPSARILAATAPSPTPPGEPIPLPTITVIVPPPQVEVSLPAGDPTLDIIALVVSSLAAVVGLIAAVASWRAASAARDAAASGKQSAQHAATAADAAERTAATEWASYMEHMTERRRAQAERVTVTWQSVTRGGGDAEVNLSVVNRSDAPITDVRVYGIFSKERATVDQRMSPFAPGTKTIWLALTKEIPENYEPGQGRGVIEFTDANGVRWQRWTGTSPVELEVDIPGHGDDAALPA